MSAVRHPAKTILVAEHGAFVPYSWHKPKQPISSTNNWCFNNAMDMVGFVDGHVNYIKMYWMATPTPKYISADYDPPAGYEYLWSGD
jgi:hypothetical protein